MDITAKVSTKGQVTIPKKVRDAIGIAAGDEVVFRIDGPRAVLARADHLLSMDTVTAALDTAKPNVPWDAARRSVSLSNPSREPQSRTVDERHCRGRHA